MGRLSTGVELALPGGSGYDNTRSVEAYPVLELALPSGTRRYGTKGVSSDARGGIEPRIAQWGVLHDGIDPFTYSLTESELTPELDDADEDPALRRLFAREAAKYPNQLRGSAATIRLISPNWSDADSYVAFTGILDGADQIAPMRWRLRLRPDDGPLRSTGSDTGGLPKVQLSRYFTAMDPAVQDHYAPIVYGVHNSSGCRGGFVPGLLVDTANAKYLLSLGHLKSVSAVYVDETVVAASTYTVTYEVVKGALFTFIDFTSPQTGEVTADVEGLTDATDGTGTLFTDPAKIIKHVLVNFGFGNWRNGSSWLADSTAPIDATSFDTVGTFLTTLGHEGSLYLAGDSQVTLLDLFNKFLEDHAAYAWWSNLGKLTVSFLDHRAPFSPYPATPLIESDLDDLGGFQTTFDPQGIQRALDIRYLRAAADGQAYQSLLVSDLSVSEDVTRGLSLEWAKASLF